MILEREMGGAMYVQCSTVQYSALLYYCTVLVHGGWTCITMSAIISCKVDENHSGWNFCTTRTMEIRTGVL